MLDSKLGRTIGSWLQLRLGFELAQQGHSLTGSLVQSIEYKIQERTNGLTLDFYSNDYGVYLNTGVSAARIPYSGNTGRGGKSKYIEGLIRYVERRMNLRGKEAIGVAFAIARKQKREGMPTQNSYRFSKNGRRTGWVDYVLENQADELDAYIEQWVADEIQALFFNYSKNIAA